MAKIEPDSIGVFGELLSTFSSYHQIFRVIINFFELSSNKNDPFDTIFSSYVQIKKISIDNKQVKIYI